jgi:PAS domain S-box-containing protein
MQEAKIQKILSYLSGEHRQFIDTTDVIPYVALPPEKPEIIFFAGKIKELTGYDANEILTDRQHWEKMIYPDDCEQVFAAFARCKNEGLPFTIEYRMVRNDGSLCYVLDKGKPVFNDKGEIAVDGVIIPLKKGMKPDRHAAI